MAAFGTQRRGVLAGGGMLAAMQLVFPFGMLFLAYVLLRSLGAGMLLMVRPAEPLKG